MALAGFRTIGSGVPDRTVSACQPDFSKAPSV